MDGEGWRVESGEWRVESGEWMKWSGVEMDRRWSSEEQTNKTARKRERENFASCEIA